MTTALLDLADEITDLEKPDAFRPVRQRIGVVATVGATGTPVTAYVGGATTAVPVQTTIPVAVGETVVILQDGPLLMITGTADTGWHRVGTVGEPAFQNGWTDFDAVPTFPVCFRKVGGMVRLDGLAKDGTMSTTMFTLPTGYRPRTTQWIGTASATAWGGLVVWTDGRVQPEAGSNTWFSLSGVSFPVYS